MTKQDVNVDVEKHLSNLGYRKTKGSEWQKDGRVVHVPSSGYYGSHFRITWKEKWKKDHAIVYDFSKANGPVCIVSIPEFFNTDFIQEKKQQQSYADSGYWWTQTFSIEHELAQFVLSYKDRWDIL
jgi:hypothetical protein